MAEGKKWTLVLRCYGCGQRFAIPDLTIERLATVAEIAPCPHCSARPLIAAAPDRNEESILHRIADLTQQTEPIYRRDREGETWHFSEKCSQWPTEHYEERTTPPAGEICNECKSKPSR